MRSSVHHAGFRITFVLRATDYVQKAAYLPSIAPMTAPNGNPMILGVSLVLVSCIQEQHWFAVSLNYV